MTTRGFIIERDSPKEFWGCLRYVDKKIVLTCRGNCGYEKTYRSSGDIKYQIKIGRFTGYCRPCLNSGKLAELVQNPFTIEEYDGDAAFDYDNQRHEIVSGRKEFVIDKICSDCGDKKPFRVRSIRETLRLKGKIQSKCTECFRNGRYINNGGYVMVLSLGHPKAQKSGYVPEHRLVIEEWLGRFLSDSETVHHKNGIRDDNRLENLQLRQGSHGQGVVRYCGDCGSHNILHGDL
jgi:hypothetical protein